MNKMKKDVKMKIIVGGNQLESETYSKLTDTQSNEMAIFGVLLLFCFFVFQKYPTEMIKNKLKMKI